jgi:hypothetical protein
VEDLAEAGALAEDGQPRQAGLEALEAKLLEKTIVVDDGTAPLGVVILLIDCAIGPPGAALLLN